MGEGYREVLSSDGRRELSREVTMGGNHVLVDGERRDESVAKSEQEERYF